MVSTLTPDRAVPFRSLAGDIVLCSWSRTLDSHSGSLHQVYKQVSGDLMLGV